MRTFLLIGIILLLLGPLRPWVGRHWAFLLCTMAGAVCGFMVGALILSSSGGGLSLAVLPLLGALAGAIVIGDVGPAWLRRIEKDGKHGQSSRRH
jgi:hypothetical protein